MSHVAKAIELYPAPLRRTHHIQRFANEWALAIEIELLTDDGAFDH